MPVDVTAEMHAGDDFLPDVAALCVRNRVEVVEVRFLGDRVVVDIDTPFWAARLDTRDLPRAQPCRRRASVHRCAPDGFKDLERHEQIVPLDAEVGYARDQNWRRGDG